MRKEKRRVLDGIDVLGELHTLVLEVGEGLRHLVVGIEALNDIKIKKNF